MKEFKTKGQPGPCHVEHTDGHPRGMRVSQGPEEQGTI